MIQIFCGEDSSASRDAYFDYKKLQENKGVEVLSVDKSALIEISKWLYESQSLFSLEKIFFSENILSKKENRQQIELFDKKEGPDIVIWEENLTDREVKRFFKTAMIKSFKLPQSIFTLLDAVYPSNKKTALQQLISVLQSVEENILFFMLIRHIRELLMAKGEVFDEKKQAWQIGKIRTLASKWTEVKLISFYEALFRIESTNKSGKSYYTLSQSLDILFCYYL